MNKKIKTKLAFSIIAIVAIIAGSTIWLGSYVYNQNLRVSQPVLQQISQNSTVSSTNANASTNDWMSYQNEEYGFEFSYPKKFGEVSVKTYEQRPPVGSEGKGINIYFSNNDTIWFSIFVPKVQNIAKNDLDLTFNRLRSECQKEGINREEIYYCDTINFAGQNNHYKIGLNYIPEGSGVQINQISSVIFIRNKLTGEIVFHQDFAEIDKSLEKLYNSSDDATLKKTALGYIEKLYSEDPRLTETHLTDQFNQLISTFKFVN